MKLIPPVFVIIKKRRMMRSSIMTGAAALVLLILSGCARSSEEAVVSRMDDSVQTIALQEVARLEVRDFVRSNLVMCMGLYDGEVYYLQEFEDSFRLFFFHPETGRTHAVTFPRGKGPGEFLQAMGVRILDRTIMIPDFFMKRLNMFGLDGSFIDSFQMDARSGLDSILNFTLEGETLYYCGMRETLVGKYDVRSMTVEKTVSNGNHDVPRDGDPFSGVSLVKDKEGFLYAGHINAPYRITVFNEDLETVKEIRVENREEYVPVKWAIGPGFTSNAGDHVISTMALHKGVLAAPECSLRIRRQGNRFSLEDFRGTLYVFDTAQGTLALVLTHPLFEHVSILSVVGMDDGHLVFYLYRQPEKGDEGVNAIVVCRVPPEMKGLFRG